MGGDNYSYPVAFKCHQRLQDLKQDLKTLKNKLLLYFQKKSESNGGECDIRDIDYSRGYILIYFKDKEAQKGVLKKNHHQIIINDTGRTTLQLSVCPVELLNARSSDTSNFSQGKPSDHGATGSSVDGDIQQGSTSSSLPVSSSVEEQHPNRPDDGPKRAVRQDVNSSTETENEDNKSPSHPNSGDGNPKIHESDSTRYREWGTHPGNVKTNYGDDQNAYSATQRSQTENENNKGPLYSNWGEGNPKIHESDSTRYREGGTYRGNVEANYGEEQNAYSAALSYQREHGNYKGPSNPSSGDRNPNIHEFDSTRNSEGGTYPGNVKTNYREGQNAYSTTHGSQTENQNSNSPSYSNSGDGNPKIHEYDFTKNREMGTYPGNVQRNYREGQNAYSATQGSQTENQNSNSPSYPNSGDGIPKIHEHDPTKNSQWVKDSSYGKTNDGEEQNFGFETPQPSPTNEDSANQRDEYRQKSLARSMSREDPMPSHPAYPVEIFTSVTARLDKKKYTENVLMDLKANIPSLETRDNQNLMEVTGGYTEIQEVYQYLLGQQELGAEKPSERPSEGSPTESQEHQVSFPSALYEYIMEIYKTEIAKMEKHYKVKIEHQSKGEGSTYVRFIPQGSESSPEKAKEIFTDKVQKVMGDWSQQKVDPSVVSLTFSNIKQRVRDNWSNILVIRDGDADVILRGPKDELSQAMKILEKGDYKPARPRRVVTISSDISTEIPVDARHLDILKKLKPKELSDIEEKYNVKMEERVKNGNVLITFRAISAPPDLSPHASHSFITLLQKTFFNIKRKKITVKSEFNEEGVGILQEQLKMGGIDIVMEYAGDTVVLIGHPIHIAFAEELLNGDQKLGGGQKESFSGGRMDNRDSSTGAHKAEEPDKCPVCLEEMEDKVLLDKCKHAYCRECLKKLTAHKPACAICGATFGMIRGDQPDGIMRHTTLKYPLPGYSGCGTIEINYDIPGGTQTENHPHPGRYFSGTSRRAYLPDNHEGRDILRLLRQAFDRRLIFTIGESRTTGEKDTVTWNDIHHKTSTSGGPQGFGYPDPEYLKRVRDELKAKGVE